MDNGVSRSFGERVFHINILYSHDNPEPYTLETYTTGYGKPMTPLWSLSVHVTVSISENHVAGISRNADLAPNAVVM